MTVDDGPPQLADFTDAPARIRGSVRLGGEVGAVWHDLTDAHALASWLPLATDVAHDSGAATPRHGDLRRVTLLWAAPAALPELILWHTPPSTGRGGSYGYSVRSPLLPFTDHAASFSLLGLADGGCAVHLEQRFHTRYGPPGWIAPHVMRQILAETLRRLSMRHPIGTADVSVTVLPSR